MQLLAGTNYDPATQGFISLASLAAMTAVDTTNLRLTFTVPSNGIVQVRMFVFGLFSNVIAQMLLGVLQGTTVVRRAPPTGDTRSAGGFSFSNAEVRFLVTALTPGASLTWDAAFCVETATSGNIQWGGPNDATIANASGGFSFEIWDVS